MSKRGYFVLIAIYLADYGTLNFTNIDYHNKRKTKTLILEQNIIQNKKNNQCCNKMTKLY